LEEIIMKCLPIVIERPRPATKRPSRATKPFRTTRTTWKFPGNVAKRSLFRLAGLWLFSQCLGCLTDPQIKVPFPGAEPLEMSDGWELSTPEAEGLDPVQVKRVYEDFFSEERFPTLRSLLIVRHGKLVAEGYSRDPRDRDRFHHVQSVTKSVTSLLVGIAQAEGLVGSLDTPLYDLMPEHFDEDMGKRAITLRHVLTMRTGLEFGNKEAETGPYIYSGGSSVAYVLRRPLVSEPGASFYYHDLNPQLASGVLQVATGMAPEAYAQERLFGPLGIRDYQWEKHADGLNFGAFGLWLRPRDMAKIGQLMLQEGVWDGRQIVPREWIEASTRIYANGDYGYYWWISQENRVYRASGDGGQRIFVDEGNNLVIVLTGDPGSKSWVLSQGMDDLFYGILGAVRE
jgi:CubicO group peptidase (beta-lactamase class C family)